MKWFNFHDATLIIMLEPLHDPHHIIVRKVLLYPANGDEPRWIDGVFSQEGANRPFAYFTTALVKDYDRHFGNITIFAVSKYSPKWETKTLNIVYHLNCV